jgi:hypothetical protein
LIPHRFPRARRRAEACSGIGSRSPSRLGQRRGGGRGGTTEGRGRGQDRLTRNGRNGQLH